MPAVLVTNKLDSKELDFIRQQFPERFRLLSLNMAHEEEFVEKAVDVDYFLASGNLAINSNVLNAAGKLKMIQRVGVGYNNIELDELKKRGIPVYINYGINAISVAEHTVMLILAVLRRLPLLGNNLRNGIWMKNEMRVECRELYGKTVGLVGLGYIGSNVAKRLHAFGTKVIYYKQSRLSEDVEKEMGVSYRSFMQLLIDSDIISLHLPLNPETKGLISDKQIAIMKKGAIIINTSRGPLIDENALVEALKSGYLGGAGLDVFSEEPLPQNNPLLGFNNVVVSPHMAGVTLDSSKRAFSEAINNIILFDNGEKLLLESKRLI